MLLEENTATKWQALELRYSIMIIMIIMYSHNILHLKSKQK